MAVNKKVGNLTIFCGGIILAATLVKGTMHIYTPNSTIVSIDANVEEQDDQIISEKFYQLKTKSSLEVVTLQYRTIDENSYNILDTTPNVHTVNFVDCTVKDLTIIEGNSQIRNIGFYNCDLGERVFDALKDIDTLQTLTLYCHLDKSEIEKIARIDHLKNLEIQVLDDFDYRIFEEISFDSLEKFILLDPSSNEEAIDFSYLTSLPNVKTFQLSTIRKAKNLDFSRFPNIEELIIPLNSFDDSTFLGKMENLRSLTLVSVNDTYEERRELINTVINELNKNPHAASISTTIWINGFSYHLETVTIKNDKNKIYTI